LLLYKPKPKITGVILSGLVPNKNLTKRTFDEAKFSPPMPKRGVRSTVARANRPKSCREWLECFSAPTFDVSHSSVSAARRGVRPAQNQFAILFENRLPNSSFTNSSFTQSF